MTATNAADSAWPAADIDAYLHALAKIAAPAIVQRWPEFLAAAESQVNHLDGSDAKEMRTFWDLVTEAGPDQFAILLTTESDLGRRVRLVTPLYQFVDRASQEAVLRESALSGAQGPEWAERWAEEAPPGTVIEALIDSLLQSMSAADRESFSEFVTSAVSPKWLIASDFCLHDVTRHNEVFAYTLFAHDADFKDRAAEIQSIFPRDLKKANAISDEMAAYLRSGRRFHFVFIVNSDRALLTDVQAARAAIDESVAMMRKYRDAANHESEIREMLALRQEANANNFNYGLLQDIILASTFGAFIALLIQLEGRGELIGWFPDRDKMTTAYGAIAYMLFANNASAFAMRRKVPEAKIALGQPGPRDDGRPGMYFDELVRIPDYIAGAAASTTFDGVQPTSIKEKHADIVGKVFADNDRIVLFKLLLPPKPLQVSRLTISSAPPN